MSHLTNIPNRQYLHQTVNFELDEHGDARYRQHVLRAAERGYLARLPSLETPRASIRFRPLQYQLRGLVPDLVLNCSLLYRQLLVLCRRFLLLLFVVVGGR